MQFESDPPLGQQHVEARVDGLRQKVARMPRRLQRCQPIHHTKDLPTRTPKFDPTMPAYGRQWCHPGLKISQALYCSHRQQLGRACLGV